MLCWFLTTSIKSTKKQKRVQKNLCGQTKKSKKFLAQSDSVTIIVTVMARNVQFSIAVHLMAGLAHGCGKDITSGNLAMSVNTSPSFVRRVLAKLSKAGS